jgi:hypothetical protein
MAAMFRICSESLRVGATLTTLLLLVATATSVEAAPPSGGNASCSGNSQSKGSGNSADCRNTADDDGDPAGEGPGSIGDDDAASDVQPGSGESGEPGESNAIDGDEAVGEADLGGALTDEEPLEGEGPGGGAEGSLGGALAVPAESTQGSGDISGPESTDGDDGSFGASPMTPVTAPGLLPPQAPTMSAPPSGLVLVSIEHLFGRQSCNPYVFHGGTLLELEEALGAIGVPLVWARAELGEFRVFIPAAPTIVNEPFEREFTGGFSSPTTMVGCR